MRKNMLTIIILAMALINVVLSAVIIFVVVPTSNKTNNLVSKVASIIDLELESPDVSMSEISVSDITTHDLPNKLQITLKKKDEDSIQYAILNVSISINTSHKEYETLEPKIGEYTTQIEEIVTEEFGKYTIDNVIENKSDIKAQVLKRIQELFQSDFIINVSFGNLILK